MATGKSTCIAICNKDKEKGGKLLRNVADVLKRNGFSGEITLHVANEKITELLKQNMYAFDIFILDAADDSCMELAKMLRRRNCIASIIFCVKKETKIMDILPFRPSGVLAENYSEVFLEKVVKHSYKEQLCYHPHFPIKNKDVMLRISYDDILYFESRQKVCIIHTKNQEIQFYAKMSDVEKMVPQEEFLRCHQSFLINMKQVIRLDKTNRCFELPMEYRIGISKANYTSSVAAYEHFFEQF